MAQNRKINARIKRISDEFFERLVETVKNCADRSLASRKDLYHQLEPFMAELGETRENTSVPIDRKDEFGYAFNEMVKAARKGKKYRATFFAWLSYYHIEEAERFRLSVLKEEGIDVPHYEGVPDAYTLSDQAAALFELKEDRVVPQTDTNALEVGKEARRKKRLLQFRIFRPFVLGGFGLFGILLCFEAWRFSTLYFSESNFSTYWQTYKFREVKIDESQLDNFESLIENGILRPRYGNNHIDTVGLADENGFLASGDMKDATLMSRGEPIKVIKTLQGYKGQSKNRLIFQLKVSPDGRYEFRLHDVIDHKQTGSGESNVFLDFLISTKLLTGSQIDGATLRINISDSVPRAIHTFCNFYEANIAFGQGAITGNLRSEYDVDVKFGPDDGGHVHIGKNVEVLSDSHALQSNYETIELFSKGRPVEISKTTDTTVIAQSGESLIFIFKVEPETGKYSYTQYAELDQQKNKRGKNVVVLRFELEASDGDGNSTTSYVDIDVYDRSYGRRDFSVNQRR